MFRGLAGKLKSTVESLIKFPHFRYKNPTEERSCLYQSKEDEIVLVQGGGK